MTGRAKKQHTSPRFYLQGFAADDGQLCTFDSQANTVRRTSPQNTGFEGNIYSPDAGDGTRFDDIENRLATIESVSAPLLADLRRFRKLTPIEKQEVSYFLATMFCRSPSQIRQFAAMQAKMADWATDIAIERGHVPQADPQIETFLRDKRNYRIDVDRRVGLKSFVMAEPLAQLMLQMTWTFEVSETQQLITSDNALFWIAGAKILDDGRYGFGLSHPNAVIPFPISPNTILRLDWVKAPSWTRHRLDKKGARLANKYQAKYAERFLYYRDEDEGIRRLGFKYAEPTQNIDVGRQSPAVHVMRKL